MKDYRLFLAYTFVILAVIILVFNTSLVIYTIFTPGTSVLMAFIGFIAAIVFAALALRRLLEVHWDKYPDS